MNTKRLADLYDRLTPRERQALLIAASVRGDTSECERLNATAPSVTWKVAHNFGLAQALWQAADLHLITLLDLAAKFWQGWGLEMLHTVASLKSRRRRKGITANSIEFRS